MTLHLVTDGEYSDYRVLGLYSTPELAAAAKELFAAHNDIATFELDALPEHPPSLVGWAVLMGRDGETGVELHRDSPRRVSATAVTPRYYFSDSWNNRVCLVAHVWALDARAANEIVNDLRLRLLAEGKWGVSS